ncbi:MAG: F0F1 ATP synthase subunit B [Lachnospiraceae bacterium]|nr:F0F1 ATP synthase subunit B [Lachnospiraceae bacterium]
MLRLDWNIVFTIINILVLYLILKKFLMTPVLTIMQKRQEMVDQEFKDAQVKQETADNLKKKYEDGLAKTKEESARILEEARQSAKVQYEAKVKKAEEDARLLLENAREKAENERQKTFRDLESEIGRLAMAAADKIIKERAGKQADHSLFNQFLAKAAEIHDTDRN